MPKLRADELREQDARYMQNDVSRDFPAEVDLLMKVHGVSRSAISLRGSLNSEDVAVFIRRSAGWKWLCMLEDVLSDE